MTQLRNVYFLSVAFQVLRQQSPPTKLADVPVADLRASFMRSLGPNLLLTLPLAQLLLGKKTHESVILHLKVFVKHLSLVFDIVLGNV